MDADKDNQSAAGTAKSADEANAADVSNGALPKEPKKKRPRKGPDVDENFDDLQFDNDLSTEARTIVERTIKISQGLCIKSGTIFGEDARRQTFEYPGVFFIKKMRDNKCFRFNFPLKDAGKVVCALNQICNANKIEMI